MSFFKSVVALTLYTTSIFTGGYYYVQEVQQKIESQIREQDMSLKLQVSDNMKRTEILLKMNMDALNAINVLNQRINELHPSIKKDSIAKN